MDQIDMDVEESRRILLDPEDDNNNDEDEDVSLTKDEEEEKNNIVKLSSYNFSKSPTSSSRSNGKSLTRGMSFQPSVMDDDSDAFGVDAFNKDDNDDDSAEDETDDDYEHGPTKKASQMYGGGQYSEDERDDENDDEDDDDVLQVEGVYDPREFDHLNVNQEISSIFSYIQKYKAQTIILDYKLKPFIPDYIPAVGDIDAFLKVTTPDESKEKLGLTVLDEPQAGQSDPNVLDLQLRALTKHSAGKTSRSKKVTGGEVAGREVEKWIHDISDLHRSKPPPSVNYRHPMPDIDKLMQEWPKDFEDTMSKLPMTLPDTSQVELETIIDIMCNLLDIPVNKSRVESLHMMFSLYLSCQNSSHLYAQDRKQISRGFLDPL